MSEATVETVIGTLDGITEKPSGWTEIQVRVEGWQYPVKMATKLTPLVELARAAGTSEMEWTFKKQESDQLNPHSGKPYVNRYFEGVGAIGESTERVATPAAAPRAEGVFVPSKTPDGTLSQGMSKEEWARKDSAIHKMACVKTAAAALTHTLPSDPTDEDLATFLRRAMILSSAWHRSVLAERDDPAGENVPF